MRTLACDARVLGGRFCLIRQLGEGGMGVVWEAEELASRRKCAIKFIKEEERTPAAEKRFLREAEAANAVHHPSILRVDEVAFDEDGTPAFVMELLEGETLSSRLERGSLSVGQTAAILRPVVSALRAAHAGGVVHRDLKPDNIFLALNPDGTVGVRVLDFGIARQFNRPADKLTVTGTLLGTPLYMSPEQAGGERGLDQRTDAWSLAVIVFECLTGTTPVTGDNYGQLLSRLIRGQFLRLVDMPVVVPDDLRAVVDAVLVERARRSADLGPLEDTLARYADPEIERPAPRVILSSDPELSVGPHETGGETMLVAARAAAQPSATRASRGLVAAIGAAFALLLAVGVVAGVSGLRARHRAAAATTTNAAAAGQGVQVDTKPSEGPVRVTDLPLPMSASAQPAAEPSAKHSPGTKPRATQAPRASASAGAPTTTPASRDSGPKRLQGGVAGDVPF